MTEAPLQRLPAVLDMVDVDSEKWRILAQTVSAPRRWIYAREARCLARFEQVAVRHARTTFVVNERERETLLRLVPDAVVHTMPNGIDVAGFAPPAAPGDPAQVVFCGVMNYPPNEEAAVWLARSIWPIVHQQRPDATLVLVGSNPTRAVRELRNVELGISVTGEVPDVRPYLWNAAVAAAPLRIARGVQNKVLEAVAAGLPVVSTAAVAAGLPAEMCAAIRVADDAESFATALLKLLDLSPLERRQIAGRADLRALSWPVRLHELPAILARAASS
jgi:sugar transferase (PEP-CTERM/EpsH1 system associated)